jgi:hypothetical protein
MPGIPELHVCLARFEKYCYWTFDGNFKPFENMILVGES